MTTITSALLICFAIFVASGMIGDAITKGLKAMSDASTTALANLNEKLDALIAAKAAAANPAALAAANQEIADLQAGIQAAADKANAAAQ